MSVSQAAAFGAKMELWVRALVEIIEGDGGASGGRAWFPACSARSEAQPERESPAEAGLFGGQQGLRYCFFSGAVLPLPDMPPLPDVDGLVKLPPPDMPPLPDVDGLVEGEVPPAPPLRASRRQFSRSAPVRAAHFAGTSVEEPLAELPLVPLDALSLWACVERGTAKAAAAATATSVLSLIGVSCKKLRMEIRARNTPLRCRWIRLSDVASKQSGSGAAPLCLKPLTQRRVLIAFDVRNVRNSDVIWSAAQEQRFVKPAPSARRPLRVNFPPSRAAGRYRRSSIEVAHSSSWNVQARRPW
jgi:hypothetical protein